MGWTEVKQIIQIYLDYVCYYYDINYIVFRLNDKEFLCRSLSMDEWEVNGIKVSSRAIGNLLENWLSV